MQVLPAAQSRAHVLMAYQAPAAASGLAEEPSMARMRDDCQWDDPRDCPTCSQHMLQQQTQAPQPSQQQADQPEQAAADALQSEQQGSSKAQRRREKQQRHRQVRCRAPGASCIA